MKEFESVFKSIKNKEFLPLYFFHGEESYYMDILIKYFEHEVLAEDAKAFDQSVFHGKDTSYTEVFSLARQYPMMGEKTLIIVKEAQDLRLDEAQTNAFLAYLNNPIPSSLVVFAHKNRKLDGKKRKLNELLNKQKCVFISEKYKDYQLAKFIQELLNNNKIKYNPIIPEMLAEYLGNDLSRIANEIHKLKLVLEETETLDEALIERHIGISKDFNVFELQNAIGEKHMDKALRIAHFMGKNPKNNAIVLAIGSLSEYFSKIIMYHCIHDRSNAEIASVLGINPFIVRNYALAAKNFPIKLATRCVSILREIDMKSKGLGAKTTDAELYIEMVYKIMNVDKILVKT